ncbi:type VII secretion protein EccB [Mycobacterium sp. ACS4331]|uniref:type VII secretion protein EccB n=1 Tax=Mycobacterium sp. ACS4331 TaxID=1834121 RepID=UPI0007FFF66D|nr:type VII secretion protein EccB [Mycobacterium sp. ACS4331]OBF25935.1 type VII secretion protein EccB [Mycobacterium sp. ACS4331]
MPLNLSNRDQNSGHLFYNRRLKAAITRFSVRMKHDDRKQSAAVALSIVFVLIGVGWMALLHVLKPAGLVGDSNIVGDRDTGAVYAKIDGRLYPALNLTSARLATGSNATPVWVKSSEILKFPTGPRIGIPGAPEDLAVTTSAVSAWSVCDTAPARRTGAPVVTAIAGQLSRVGRAAPMAPEQAVLATHGDQTYVIWDGRRSRIDPADRTLTFNLGLDPGETFPIRMSNALFDALPATEPLVVPAIPELGARSRWLPDIPIGTVLQSQDAAGTVSGFYVLLPSGVQQVSAFVADLLRTAVTQSSVAPVLVSPDKLVDIPDVDVLNVGFYPSARFRFVDTEANPTTCVAWEKMGTDRQATVTVFNGRGLPVLPSQDNRLVRLVRNDRHPDSVEADQTLILPGAANFVATTSGVVTADTRESLYWIAPQGVRYGISWDDSTLNAVGLNPGLAVQAPWPIIRTFAAGPAISRADALLARDTLPGGGTAAAIPGGGG